jgi:hypothetical protein
MEFIKDYTQIVYSYENYKQVVKNDLDGWVKRDAEASLNKIKDWFIE